MSATDSESKTKSDVYRERNLLALAFVRAVHYDGYEAGWWPDRDTVNGEQWAVVWANLGHPDHQVGWHVPLDLVPWWLPKRDPDYDGYTTVEKNHRVAAYAGVNDE